ncbi:MAG: hypothetical protein GF416_04070 [Candidatus Altiarchaeales archaeon]|nr:hypothetical protein [Candidatus Altiarchaeales archaeon]MBD3416296.1 hypothetical protein [Candidatus Altiarchaeales archaeon]
MKLILYSQEDLAGSNIARILVNSHGFSESGEYYYGSPIHKKKDVLLIGTHTSVRDLVEIPFDPEVCLVASRHRSDSGKPTLTCHATGNYGRADLGGRENTLQLTHAHYLREALLMLKDRKREYDLGYDVTLEVTHHGPTGLPFPLLFVEVGSSAVEWSSLEACNAVSETIYDLMFSSFEAKTPAIGFGGPHYAPNFTLATRKYAIGHIMPKHAMESLTKTMVEEMIEKTLPRAELAIIDWKGLRSKERNRLVELLDELGVSWIKTSDAK